MTFARLAARMAIVIERLDKPQLLLLYLAGELPADDKAEVERQLASDKSLAAELDRIASIRLKIEQGLTKLDRSSGLSLRSEAAGRQVGRDICRWLAQPKSAAPTAPAKRHHHLMPWLVPAGIAAAVVIGIMGWVGHQRAVSERQLAHNSAPQEQDRITVADSEPNMVLLEQSIKEITNDDDSGAIARLDAKDSVASGDEISQYLFKLETAH